MQIERMHQYELPLFEESNACLDINIDTETKSSSRIYSFSILEKKIIPSDICIIKNVGMYSLNRYLILEVRYENEIVFVENREFNLWGEGNSLDDAINSFKDFFLYDLNSYLNTTEEKMDYFAQQEQKKYKSIIQK